MNKLHLLVIAFIFCATDCFATTISFEIVPPTSQENNFILAPKLSDYSIHGAGIIWKDGADHDNGVYTTTTTTMTDYYGKKVSVPGYMDITIEDKKHPKEHFAKFTLSSVGLIGSTAHYQLYPYYRKGMCIIASVRNEHFSTQNCSDNGPTNLDEFPLLKDDNINIILRPMSE